MDAHQRHRVRKIYKKLIQLRPYLTERNPTPEMEMAEAQWMLGEECKKLMKHIPEIHAKVIKEAQWFLKHGRKYPLTLSTKHIISKSL